MEHSQEILHKYTWLNKDDTHKNKNCVHYMSKSKAIRINCTVKGFISRELCTLECKHRNIK